MKSFNCISLLLATLFVGIAIDSIPLANALRGEDDHPVELRIGDFQRQLMGMKNKKMRKKKRRGMKKGSNNSPPTNRPAPTRTPTKSPQVQSNSPTKESTDDYEPGCNGPTDDNTRPTQNVPQWAKQCDWWATQGFCSSNQGWMHNNCATSCCVTLNPAPPTDDSSTNDDGSRKLLEKQLLDAIHQSELDAIH